MKNKLLLLILLIFGISSCAQKAKERVVVAYVTAWKTESIPDPTYITHINYAFGHVNETFDGVRISNEDRLRQIVELKKKKPSLKVLLSIGGWGSGRFSEMADSAEYRRAFASDCKRVIDEFNLDGIDIDWEYPTSSVAKISSSPRDTENFTLMMGDIRHAIGKKKLLTLASDAMALYTDFKNICPYVNFVNIMTYDIAETPFHHSALFCSEMTNGISCETSINAHVQKGMPIERLVLGIPFFGYTTPELNNRLNYGSIKELTGYTRQWDNIAKAPYLVDSLGNVVCNYEDEESIRIKCKHLNDLGLMGAMYWEYDGDDAEGTMRKAVYEGVFEKE